jgi:hypothetical protein
LLLMKINRDAISGDIDRRDLTSVAVAALHTRSLAAEAAGIAKYLRATRTTHCKSSESPRKNRSSAKVSLGRPWYVRHASSQRPNSSLGVAALRGPGVGWEMSAPGC